MSRGLRQINLTVTEQEYISLLHNKGLLTWHEFIMKLANNTTIEVEEIDQILNKLKK